MAATDDIWAAGSGPDIGDPPLVKRWDGTSWQTVTVPDPSGRDSFSGIAAITGTDVWAVGSHQQYDYRTLAEHFDGTGWTVVPTPNIGSGRNQLMAIDQIGQNDVWAVGWHPTGALILHWNGASWSISPTTSTTRLWAVDMVAADDGWAVGDSDGAKVLHWDGQEWTDVPGVSQGHLYGVDAVDETDVWAVGWEPSAHPLVLHRTADGWDAMRPAGAQRFYGVDAAASNDVWAVGESHTSRRPLVAHWDGRELVVVPVPRVRSDPTMYDVVAVSETEVWAVGGSYGRGTIMHFCPSLLTDAGILDPSITVPQGHTVVWKFGRANTGDRRIVDDSGLELFDSGLKPPGSLAWFRFDGAGTYHMLDPETGTSQDVAVPLVAKPRAGDSSRTYTITWSRYAPGPDLAFDIQVKRPGSETFEDWLTDQEGRSARFTPDGGGGTYTFRGRVHSLASGAGSGWSPPRSIDVTALAADVDVAMTDAPDPVAADGTLSYHMVVTNRGPESAGNVQMKDELPEGVQVISAQATQGGCAVGPTVTCSLGSLEKDTAALITLRVEPSVQGTLTNSIRITTGSTDPDPSDNEATVTTRVGPSGCSMFGTDGNDTLAGTAGADNICGLNGDDRIDPRGGNDTVQAGIGNDTVVTSEGDDTIIGGPGDDTLSGGAGDDSLFGERGFDALDGGSGTDACDIGPEGGSVVRCE